MEKEIRIKCPCCDSILIVDRISGKILETRKPIIEHSTGDRLDDAFLKSEQDRVKRDSVFANIKQSQEEKRKMSEELFKASLEDARKEAPTKPRSIFDAD